MGTPLWHLMEILCVLLFLLVHPAAVFADQPRNGACRDNRDEFGFALVGHDYKTVHADNFGRCFFECSLEEKCQSVSYYWNNKECKMNNETKKSRPEDFKENPIATYMGNSFRAKKGSKDFVPGSSCKDIMISGDAQGDGEYWIDPTASGDPFPVFCDMTTDGGGWTLITQFVMRAPDSVLNKGVKSNSYRMILSEYGLNNRLLMRKGFATLHEDMAFTQIRFYCFKKKPGRVFHIMTNKNSSGTEVVKYFTTSNVMPVACGSFTRLPDDNSSLAANCDKWGHPTLNRWGNRDFRKDHRLFSRPMAWRLTIFYRIHGTIYYKCDDGVNEDLSLHDTWKIFVR